MIKIARAVNLLGEAIETIKEEDDLLSIKSFEMLDYTDEMNL